MNSYHGYTQSPHHPRSDKAAALATQRLIDAGVIGPNSHPVASPGMGGSAIADPDASSSSSSATKPSGEGGNGGGLAGKIPGTKAYAATHPRGAVHGDVAGAQEIGKGQEQVERQAPPRPGGFGATSTESTTKSGSVTGSTSGASAGGVSKPTLGDKISGKLDVAIGKLTHNAGKVAIGEIKQTEGKAAAEFGALGAGGAAMGGGGHTVQGAPHAKGRY